MVNSVQSQTAALQNQQSLFTAGSTRNSSSSSNESSKAGSVQQQMQVSVLKNQLEQSGSAALKLINSTRGVGQNVDTLA